MVLALVVDESERVRLRAAGAALTFEFVDDVALVLPRLRASRSCPAAILLEPRDASSRQTGGLARQILTQFRGVPVIGICQAGADHSADVMTFAQVGVDELMYRGIDDHPNALYRIVRRAERSHAAESVFVAIRDSIPARLTPMVRCALRSPRAAQSVSAVASAMEVHRKTLVNLCLRDSFPPPRALLVWCQLLLFGQYLETTTLSVPAIARRLQSPSATALRNMLKRYTGLRPREIRDGEGLSLVQTRFMDAIREHQGASGGAL